MEIVRDKDGLITSFTDGTGMTSMVYYPSTWLKQKTDPNNRTVKYEYNGVGLVSKLTAPDTTKWFTYDYNAGNQLLSVVDQDSVTQSSFTYYPNDSKLFRIYRPGSYIQYEYNARNWLIRVVNGTWPGDQVIYNVLYNVWDNVGNPLLKVEWFPGDLRYATTFTYDGVYRLTLESRNRCCLGGDPYTASYTYDQVGNRLSLTLNGTVTNYTYDDNDKLLTATSGGNSAGFGYDGAGNMLSVTGNLFGARTMVYDDASRLTSTTFPGGTDMFTYNGFGQKMGATLEGTARTYAWFGDRLIAEYGCGGCCYAGAIYTDGSYSGLWLGRQMGGQKQYPVYDSIGTVRRVVNENAATLFSNDLDAFGHAIAGSGSATWYPFRFGGAWGYTTMPSGLQQLGARFYWPELGRFIQQDPAGDGVNWYAYVGNNPLRYIDPEGLWDPDVHFRWAKASALRGGFSDADARRIGQAAHDIDNLTTLGSAPHYGNRQAYANQMAAEGVALWKQGKRTEALTLWGQGAHALEDEYAHSDISKLEHITASVFDWLTGKTGQYSIEDPQRLRALAEQARRDTDCYLQGIHNQL